MWLSAVVCVALLRLSCGATVVPWWNNAVYYRVLVDSFKDLDGDGLGDIQGATKQLSYIRALGADAVILSPLSAKSTDCGSPGTLHLAQVDPRYGSLDGVNKLLEKARKLELKVVVTLHLQTISSASEWFKDSSELEGGFNDWILWQEGQSDVPPPVDNEIHKWIWDDKRNAFWGSSNNEAILNLCSEGIMAALATAQCSWLKLGISGVLLNPDFPRDPNCGYKLLRKLAAEAISCARGVNLDTPVILVESSLEPAAAARYYGDGGVGANTVISYALTAPVRTSAPELALALHSALLYTPQDMAPAWLTSFRNQSRLATRLGSEMVDAVNILSLVMPGAVIINQGDELGAADTILEWASNTKCWPMDSIPSAAPFPWDDTVSGGFTSGEPWLPIAPNYRYANAKTEFANEHSHVSVVRVAAAMRKSPANGPHVEIKRLNDAIAVLKWGGGGSLLYVSNFGRDQTEVQLSRIPGLPAEMTVASSSGGSSLSTGSHLTLDKVVKLIPGEAVLLAGPPRHCGGPGPVDKIASKLSEGWQKINKYFSNT
ncbi:maltase A3-like [Epargyreus clarus]|uniref:maltase A3-like n=1 Tax=Epargyreus clarus TaxID=520877 RepID=UPI003C2F22DE